MDYFCPCCGYNTLSEKAGSGSYEICDICFWEDDPIQFKDQDYAGGANKPSLNEARRNFQAFGACDSESKSKVRRPSEKDILDPNWKL